MVEAGRGTGQRRGPPPPQSARTPRQGKGSHSGSNAHGEKKVARKLGRCGVHGAAPPLFHPCVIEGVIGSGEHEWVGAAVGIKKDKQGPEECNEHGG